MEQFNTYYKHNKPTSMEQAIEYFSIFGGIKIPTDFNIPIEELIQTKILDKYKFLRNDVSNIAKGEGKDFAILSAIATGDRRTNSAFRKTDVSFNDGIAIVDNLCAKKMISLEKTMQELTPLAKNNDIPERVLFTAPFLRFWFAFVSPYFKGIKDGNYEEFRSEFEKKKGEFPSLVFEQLAHEFIRNVFTKMIDDKVYKVGRYWDDDCSIDLLTKTKGGKIIAGSCKYTNSKIKKTELTKLKQTCEKLGIKVDIFVLFSKKGFSNELKGLKGDDLRLFTAKSLVQLIKEENL